MELISHDLLTFLKECVLLLTRYITTSGISSVHMPLLVFGGIQFSCGANLLFCGLEVRGRFSLLVVGSVVSKSNMLFHLP